MRYFIKLSYDGSAYNGWQSQPHEGTITVQGTVNNALQTLLRDTSIDILGCGRTDTGVHAKGYYAHFDTQMVIETEQLLFKVNRFLPDDIVIHSIKEVAQDYHARFDAVSRSYHYAMHVSKDPFAINSFYYHYALPNVDTLNTVAALFIKYQDFTAFCKANSGNLSNFCKVTECYWKQEGHTFIFKISANRFLRGMIRLIVGASLNVDRGALQISEVEDALKNGNRLSKDWSVPGHGLILYDIKYPYEVF